jgi:hypothetical protein
MNPIIKQRPAAVIKKKEKKKKTTLFILVINGWSMGGQWVVNEFILVGCKCQKN